METAIYEQRCCFLVWVIYYLRHLCHSAINLKRLYYKYRISCRFHLHNQIIMSSNNFTEPFIEQLHGKLPEQQDFAIYYRPGTAARAGWVVLVSKQHPSTWGNIGPDNCRSSIKTEGGRWRDCGVPTASTAATSIS